MDRIAQFSFFCEEISKLIPTSDNNRNIYWKKPKYVSEHNGLWPLVDINREECILSSQRKLASNCFLILAIGPFELLLPRVNVPVFMKYILLSLTSFEINFICWCLTAKPWELSSLLTFIVIDSILSNRTQVNILIICRHIALQWCICGETEGPFYRICLKF